MSSVKRKSKTIYVLNQDGKLITHCLQCNHFRIIQDHNPAAYEYRGDAFYLYCSKIKGDNPLEVSIGVTVAKRYTRIPAICPLPKEILLPSMKVPKAVINENFVSERTDSYEEGITWNFGQ